MKRWLSILAAVGLLLFPFANFAAETESQTTQETAPPVAQSLVREGDFAIKLASDLDLGKPSDESTAENLLATAGIAPTNGWISDYPVTPQIIGQLDDAIAKAAADGKLKMSAQEATNALHQIVAELNLPAPAGKETAPAALNSPTVVNNYYYNEGPPIITYYAPPVDYVYLYDWVPYPVFWFGFWFPGFYICHNFTTTVVVTQPVLFVNRPFVARGAIVSNRFVDPLTRTVVRVNPVVRTATGVVSPMTTLSGRSGRSFTTLADMRNGTALRGVTPLRTATGSRNFAGRPGSFGSTEARMGANSIFSRSVHAMNSGTGVRNGHAQRQLGTRVPGRSGSPAIRRGGESSFMRGTGGSGFNAPGRNYNAAGYAAGHGAVRTFTGPAVRNGRGSAPWFVNGTRWRG